MNPDQYALIRKTMGTQEQVAGMLGVARETIARREIGKDRITKEAGLAIIALSASPQNQKAPDEEAANGGAQLPEVEEGAE